MKKNILYSLISISFPLFGFATQGDMKCEDIGARTQTKQVFIDIGGQYPIGEPQEFCILYIETMQSLILKTTLFSKNSSLAATAYRNGPKPIVDKKERADRTYCKSLGGTYQFGSVGLNGGWQSDDSGQSGICVFADGSMISTWTLFYKRAGVEGRPDFEPFFQNRVIPANLW